MVCWVESAAMLGEAGAAPRRLTQEEPIKKYSENLRAHYGSMDGKGDNAGETEDSRRRPIQGESIKKYTENLMAKRPAIYQYPDDGTNDVSGEGEPVTRPRMRERSLGDDMLDVHGNPLNSDILGTSGGIRGPRQIMEERVERDERRKAERQMVERARQVVEKEEERAQQYQRLMLRDRDEIDKVDTASLYS